MKIANIYEVGFFFTQTKFLADLNEVWIGL